ncbi:MAG: hypothetical protein II336_18195 [Loktanella sp.]|nr:hypothetical protein [Loktanella sp.]
MQRNFLALAISKAFALLFLATPAMADCYNRDHLEAFLKSEYGMSLHSWGLTGSGDMAELWLAENGHFAAVTTTPAGCVSVLMIEHLHDRLRQPPSRNRAIPPGPLDRGEPT